MNNNTSRITRFLALSALMLLFSSGVSAQTKLQKARELKMKYEFMSAIAMYLDYIQTSTAGVDEKRELAGCYMMINDTRSAEDWLSEVVSSANSTADDVLHYAGVLKTNGKYAEAITQYKNYGNMLPSASEKAEDMIRSCRQALKWMEDPVYFEVANAETLNSENSDFGLFPFDKGYILTSDRRLKGKTYTQEEIYGWTGKPYLKLLSLNDKNNPKATMEEIDVVNNRYHNGPAVFDKNNSVLYFTRTKMVKLTKKPLNCDPTSWYDNSTTKDYVNRLELYSAQLGGGKWQQPAVFQYSDPKSFSVGHPALSPDGKILYFVSDMPGGYGATDIYFCEKFADGSWSSPKNAGNIINTGGKELFPYIANDGTLYFASDGLPGMGGLDLFSAKGSKDNWTSPENLKYPFNSPKDDFTFCFTGDGSGYLASNRDGGKGDDDIYRFSPAPPTTLVLSVITKEKLDNNATAILNGVNLQITSDSGALTVTPRDNGHFLAQAGCNTEYKVKGTKNGYFTSEKTVKTSCTTRHDTVSVELLFEKIVINKAIVLNNIYYDYDKWDIRPDAATELDKLVKIMVENPEINIELGSHTDSRGKDKYNQDLSQKRAESAVNYIISKGVDALRIKAKGYGESVPVNKCVNGVECTEEEFQMNRRTEFKVTSIGKK